jgi:hypothetical protein
MLLGFDAIRAGHFFTEVQRLPDAVPEGDKLAKASL